MFPRSIKDIKAIYLVEKKKVIEYKKQENKDGEESVVLEVVREMNSSEYRYHRDLYESGRKRAEDFMKKELEEYHSRMGKNK